MLAEHNDQRIALGLPDHVAFSDFLADISALGVVPVDRGGLRYALTAARSNPRWWLLPLDSRRAAAAGLEMLQPVTTAATLAKTVARGLARFGPHGLLGGARFRLSGWPDLDGAFEGRIAHVAYFTGTHGPHRKTALQVMNVDGKILGYAKLSRADHVRPYLRNEAKMLARVAALGLKTAEAPELLATRDDGALTLLVTDSRKSREHSAPLVPGPEHIAFLRELHACTGRGGAFDALDTLSRRASDLAPLAGRDWSTRLARADTVLRPSADVIPVCLNHGDFTPWNSFLQGGRLYVFDWEYGNSTWPVGFDLVHFMLATIPPDRQVDSLPLLTEALASTHFDGDAEAASRALLLSLVCHAVFYMNRLAEVAAPLTDWPDAPVRGAMIDRLLLRMEVMP